MQEIIDFVKEVPNDNKNKVLMFTGHGDPDKGFLTLNKKEYMDMQDLNKAILKGRKLSKQQKKF